MKTFFFLLSSLSILTALSSCKKTNGIGNSGIVGKWQLQSVFNGYANGGNFEWNDVPFEYSDILTFTKDGLYNKKSFTGNTVECIGMYHLSASDTLEINSDCNLVAEKIFMSELTIKFLIIDYRGREGKIRYRYARVK